VKVRLDLAIAELGSTPVKNIADLIRVWALRAGSRSSEVRVGR
jgi:hypothetical protein